MTLCIVEDNVKYHFKWLHKSWKEKTLVVLSECEGPVGMLLQYIMAYDIVHVMKQ